MADPARTGAAPGSTGPAAGKLAWSFRDELSRAPFAGSAAVVNGWVFVGSMNFFFLCLEDADAEPPPAGTVPPRGNSHRAAGK